MRSLADLTHTHTYQKNWDIVEGIYCCFDLNKFCLSPSISTALGLSGCISTISLRSLFPNLCLQLGWQINKLQNIKNHKHKYNINFGEGGKGGHNTSLMIWDDQKKKRSHGQWDLSYCRQYELATRDCRPSPNYYAGTMRTPTIWASQSQIRTCGQNLSFKNVGLGMNSTRRQFKGMGPLRRQGRLVART